MLAWFVIERFVDKVWDTLLTTRNQTTGLKRINSKRRDTLRKYPVSIKLHILELEGAISFDQFGILDRLRRKRNDIAHTGAVTLDDIGREADHKSCGEAFSALSDFVETHFKITIRMNTSFSLSGVYQRD